MYGTALRWIIIQMVLTVCLYRPTESSDSCGHLPFGVEDGSIHSDQLIASSIYDWRFKAERGRLNTVADLDGSGSWAAKSEDENPWIQADLSAVKSVIGVITQGREDGKQWVKTYEVYYSTNSNNFEPVLGSSGQAE
ncbi:retinoschisin-like, partial [Anneissia japonica]|uniref:retinoschisin-like n=1 Tax=Anneissia japonica TaxID=1529436 RepID=UPI00142569FC